MNDRQDPKPRHHIYSQRRLFVGDCVLPGVSLTSPLLRFDMKCCTTRCVVPVHQGKSCTGPNGKPWPLKEPISNNTTEVPRVRPKDWLRALSCLALMAHILTTRIWPIRVPQMDHKRH
jgi:hypothetical protein